MDQARRIDNLHLFLMTVLNLIVWAFVIAELSKI